ncbi:MAG TPA: apolipoprotein N-acyltransferase [Chitinophagales bacterium]|nr:apolipoprotein N-acyltransferase [Chitinophagales bacterium]
MSKSKKFLLSIFSGVLLSLAWPPLPFFPLLFIGFLPILWLDDICSESKKSARSFFGYSYLALLIWNFGTTWWVGATYFGTHDISTAIAGLLANTLNPLLMCIPLVAFHNTKKRFGPAWGYISLPAYWITFEFFHLRWDLSWPWLTLGNGLACFPQVIQWYEFTGVLGGTLWILAVNIVLYRLLYPFLSGRSYLFRKKNLLPEILLIVLPVALSLNQYFPYTEIGKRQHVVIVQPNIDPYMKFAEGTEDAQLDVLIRLSIENIDSTTDYLVWPETAIPQGILVNELSFDPTIEKVRKAFSSFPDLKIVTGINAYKRYETDSTPTARKDSDNGKVFYWDAFNSAIQLDSSRNIPIYHKSKLVPWVEKMPYPKFFKFLEPLALNMGGITGSLGSQEQRSVFFGPDSVGIAPEICYESIYGEYSNEYVRRGANLFFVITNDGWWGNTAGHKQHLEYARLLAIETRRDIAQAANTGTSAFINQRGDIRRATPWWTPVAIRANLRVNDRETFYVRFGDYIGRAAIILTLLLFVWAMIVRFRKRKVIGELRVP